MTLEFSQVRNIIIALIAIFLFSSLFGFASFLAAERAQAGIPVLDILGTAAQWIINALEKAWEVLRDGVKWVAQKAWDKLVQSWEWIRQNWQAVLLAAGLK